MNYLKDKILPLLIGAVITGIFTLLVSIFSELLPTISPFLSETPPSLYLKSILLLVVILLLCFLLIFFLYERTKEFRPFRKKGKYQGFKWIADIKDYDSRKGWDVWINFICPVHKVHLGAKDANIPECSYHVLWCSHCNKTYPIKSAGDTIHLEEAEEIIKGEVISKLRIKQ